MPINVLGPENLIMGFITNIEHTENSQRMSFDKRHLGFNQSS